MTVSEIDSLVYLMSKLPALGPRSARRAVLYLLKKKDSTMAPLITALQEVYAAVQPCPICGNMDTQSPCHICQDKKRDKSILCVVQDVSDLWALERSQAFKGVYHVLGGVLSALDGVGPEDLKINSLIEKVHAGDVNEVLLALPATVDGQTTAHYIAESLDGFPIKISRLSHGIPIGGELDYLDDGTLQTAIKTRRSL